MSEDSTMTVAELIAALQALQPDAEVLAEGCDCINPVVRVDADPDWRDGAVLLEVSL